MKAIQAIAGTRATYPLRIEEAPVGQVLGKRFSAAPVPMAIQKIRGIGGSKRVDFGQYL